MKQEDVEALKELSEKCASLLDCKCHDLIEDLIAERDELRAVLNKGTLSSIDEALRLLAGE